MLYQEKFYLDQNPDVRVAVEVQKCTDGFEHYVRFGQKEQRNPGLLFDESHYLDFNSDVSSAVLEGELLSSFQNYVLYGRAEGRAI